MVGGRARAESNPGHWARHALLHMAAECVNHSATRAGIKWGHNPNFFRWENGPSHLEIVSDATVFDLRVIIKIVYVSPIDIDIVDVSLSSLCSSRDCLTSANYTVVECVRGVLSIWVTWRRHYEYTRTTSRVRVCQAASTPATMSKQHCRMLHDVERFFRQSRTLRRHCCWCGRGLTRHLVYPFIIAACRHFVAASAATSASPVPGDYYLPQHDGGYLLILCVCLSVCLPAAFYQDNSKRYG